MTWHGTRKRAHTIRCAPSAVSPATRKRCGKFFELLLARCARSFERLPCVEDADLLRNILYSGVWLKYNCKQAKETPKKMVTNSAQKADFVLILQALSCRL